MKQAEPCGYSYGFSGCSTVLRFGVPVPVALRALDAVLVKQADVEPDGRVERAVLMQAEPGQVAIERLAVVGRGEVAVFDAPVGDRAADAVDQLPDAVSRAPACRFRRRSICCRRRWWPIGSRTSGFAVGLLEEHLAGLALDRRAADFPLDGVERVCDIGGAELGVDFESAVELFGRGFGSFWGQRSHGIKRSPLRHLLREIGHPANVNKCTCYPDID